MILAPGRVLQESGAGLKRPCRDRCRRAKCGPRRFSHPSSHKPGANRGPGFAAGSIGFRASYPNAKIFCRLLDSLLKARSAQAQARAEGSARHDPTRLHN